MTSPVIEKEPDPFPFQLLQKSTGLLDTSWFGIFDPFLGSNIDYHWDHN